MASFNKDAGAALVFGILYLGLWVWMVSGYATGRYKFRSRWSILMFHVTVRVASQGLGVAFGMIGFSNINLFVAYLILNAEGFFTLTIAAYMFLKGWQKHNWGDSWLASDRYKNDTKGHIGLLGPLLRPWRYRHHIMAPVHSLLLPANILIIVGGVMISNDYDVKDQQTNTAATDQEHTSKLIRSIGSGIFLGVAIFFNLCVYKTLGSSQNQGRKAHPTLIVLVVVGLALIVRGVFGLLQSALYSLSYINPLNYTAAGFTNRFIAIEYCLTVLPEFTCAALLNLSYFFKKQDRYPESSDIPQEVAASFEPAALSPTEEKDKYYTGRDRDYVARV